RAIARQHARRAMRAMYRVQSVPRRGRTWRRSFKQAAARTRCFSRRGERRDNGGPQVGRAQSRLVRAVHVLDVLAADRALLELVGPLHADPHVAATDEDGVHGALVADLALVLGENGAARAAAVHLRLERLELRAEPVNLRDIR